MPLDNTLVKRPIWLIEAVPNDRYYLYGKLVFGIDRETYKVCNVVKYDWRGQAMGVFNRGIAFGRAPDGYRYVNITGGGRGGAYAENMKMRREPARWQPGRFIHPHDACFDRDGNIFVVEWVPTGRVTKLMRV